MYDIKDAEGKVQRVHFNRLKLCHELPASSSASPTDSPVETAAPPPSASTAFTWPDEECYLPPVPPVPVPPPAALQRPQRNAGLPVRLRRDYVCLQGLSAH